MVKVRDLLKEFNLDNSGVLLALEKYAKRPSLPWSGEAFGFFAFAVLWLAAAALALGANEAGLMVLLPLLACGIAVQAAAMYWHARKPGRWSICAAPPLLAVGSAAAATAGLLLTEWPVLSSALLAAGAVALGRIKLSFSAPFALALLALTAALGAFRDASGLVPIFLIGAPLLIAFALVCLPAPHWDLRPHAFALITFANLLLAVSYAAAQFESEMLAPQAEAGLKAVGLFVAELFLILLMRGRDTKEKLRLAAICLLAAPAVWLTSAGAAFALATAILGFIATSRAMMVIGFISLGSFAVMAFADVAAWLVSSGFLTLIESVLLLLWKWG